MRPWSSWDEEWPVDLDFVNELAAAFLQAGARHIAAQNTRSRAAHGRRRRGDPRTPLASSVQSIIVRAVARAWGLRLVATVRVMAEKHDRELIDRCRPRSLLKAGVRSHDD